MEIGEYSNKYIHYYTGEVPEFVSFIFRDFPVDNFVDLGSGDGCLLQSLLTNGYLKGVSNVTAVDISRERLDNVGRIDGRFKCLQADACNLEMINDESMDFVVSSQVIEHVPDHDRFISEAHRILRKGAILYLSTVFKKWYGWYFYRSKGKWALDPTHFREYTDENQLLEVVRRYGFGILKNRKVLQWFPITDFILKRIGMGRNIYNNKILDFFRKVKIPILGYYNWELVLKKA